MDRWLARADIVRHQAGLSRRDRQAAASAHGKRRRVIRTDLLRTLHGVHAGMLRNRSQTRPFPHHGRQGVVDR